MATIKTTTTVSFEHSEPVEKPSPDWSQVLKMARMKFEADRDLECDPKDIHEYIFEGVMEAVYGPEFWPWSNERVGHKR